MNEHIGIGEVMCRADIEKQLEQIKTKLLKGDFSSTLRCHWTIDMDIEHIFGYHCQYGPIIVGVSVEDKLIWLKEILAIIESLKIEDLSKSVFLFNPQSELVKIIERIRRIEQKLNSIHKV